MTIHPMPSLEARNGTQRRGENEEDVFPDGALIRWALSAVALGVIVTILVYAGLIAPVDKALFDAAHSGAGWTIATAPAVVHEAVRDLTALGGTVVLTGAVAATSAYLLAARRLHLAALLVTSALMATLFSALAKALLARTRPASVEHLVMTTSASFPSGHALLSAAIILTIGGLVAFAAKSPSERRIIVVTAVAMTLCVGLSRIWLGVHWPSDVFAGWMFGSAWAALTLLLAKRIDRQGQRTL